MKVAVDCKFCNKNNIFVIKIFSNKSKTMKWNNVTIMYDKGILSYWKLGKQTTDSFGFYDVFLVVLYIQSFLFI